MENQYLQDHTSEFDSAVTWLEKELSTLRTGRANPAILDHITVESYGTQTPLKQLSSISVPEARTITIQPWDKNILQDIEKAIHGADIGISPVNDGSVIRLTMPQLTAEDRKKMVKSVSQKIEQTRIKIRTTRDKVKDDITRAEKNKEITQDNKFDFIKELDEYTKNLNEKIKEIGEKKTNIIMTV